MLRFIPVAVACLLVTSCGFQLRGSEALPAGRVPLHVAAEKESALVRTLHRQMDLRDIAMTRRAGDAKARLTLHEDNSGQRILSVAVTEGPEESEVFHTVVFSVSVAGKTLIDRQAINLTRDYTYDKNDILGKRHEFDALRNALSEEMANALLRRVRYAR